MNRKQPPEAGDLTDGLMPAVGYLRQYGSMTCRQFAEAKEQLAAFAVRRGFELGTVFVEELDSDPAAFDELVRVVKRRRIPAVFVPNEAHLSAVGQSETKAQRLRREACCHVLIAQQVPR